MIEWIPVHISLPLQHLVIPLEQFEIIFDRMFAINVKAPYFLIQAAARLMVRDGVRGAAQDMIQVGDARDPVTGLPVHSLYGHDEASLEPTPEMLRGLDAVVFDVSHLGSLRVTGHGAKATLGPGLDARAVSGVTRPKKPTFTPE